MSQKGTTSSPSRCPWISRGWETTLEPRFKGLMLDHQVLKGPEPQNLKKMTKIDQKQQFWIDFLAPAPLKLDGSAPNS